MITTKSSKSSSAPIQAEKSWSTAIYCCPQLPRNGRTSTLAMKFTSSVMTSMLPVQDTILGRTLY
jgi:hypothetical protein